MLYEVITFAFYDEVFLEVTNLEQFFHGSISLPVVMEPASGIMVRLHLKIRRLLRQAYLHALVAARRKRAASRWMHQIDRRAFNRGKRGSLWLIDLRQRIDEPLGVSYNFV